MPTTISYILTHPHRTCFPNKNLATSMNIFFQDKISLFFIVQQYYYDLVIDLMKQKCSLIYQYFVYENEIYYVIFSINLDHLRAFYLVKGSIHACIIKYDLHFNAIARCIYCIFRQPSQKQIHLSFTFRISYHLANIQYRMY